MNPTNEPRKSPVSESQYKARNDDYPDDRVEYKLPLDWRYYTGITESEADVEIK